MGTETSILSARALLACTALLLSSGCGEEAAREVPKVYVADEGSGTVSVIDATTNRLVTTIDLSRTHGSETLRFAPHNVQVAPDGKTVWVTAPPAAHEESGSEDHGEEEEAIEEVIVIDPHTDRITRRIPVGGGLHLAHVVLDSESRFAFASANEANQVLQIEVVHRIVVDRVELGAERKPHGMRFCNGRLFVANMDGKSLSIVEGSAAAPTVAQGLSAGPISSTVTEIPLGGIAVQTACTSDGRFAFASLYDTREVVRYDVASGALTRIALPAEAQGPIQLYPSPDNRRLYVCDQGSLMGRPASNKLFEIDIDTAAVTATVEVGMGAHGVVVSEDGSLVYVTNTLEDTVSVVDAATRQVTATIPVGDAPNGIAHWHITGGMP